MNVTTLAMEFHQIELAQLKLTPEAFTWKLSLPLREYSEGEEVSKTKVLKTVGGEEENRSHMETYYFLSYSSARRELGIERRKEVEEKEVVKIYRQIVIDLKRKAKGSIFSSPRVILYRNVFYTRSFSLPPQSKPPSAIII